MRDGISAVISSVIPGVLHDLITAWSRAWEDENFIILGPIRNHRCYAPLPLHQLVYRWRMNMTKLKTLGAICLALSLAAASPALAGGMRGGHGGGFHSGGAHFAGSGFRGGGYRGGGIGPGVAAGLIAGSVIGGAYGYYGAPDYGDSYGYYDGYDNYDNSGSNAFN
jgi:hypothetical protein